MKNLFPLLAVLVVGSPSVAQSQSPPALVGHSAAAHPVAPHTPAASVDVARSYGSLPLQFEPNVGQADKQVRFITHTGNGTLFLTDREAVLAVPCRDPKTTDAHKPLDARSRLRHDKPAPTRYSILRMKLVGAAKPLAMSGMDKLPGIVNYFRGKDPQQWHANIPTYRKARFAGVYKGVDMVYYGAQDGRLEYDFVVKPGADPKQIRLAFSGAKAMRVTDGGDLALQTDAGYVLWHRPVTYQVVDGKRQAIACNYQLEHEAGTPAVRFALARYDAAKPLVIDPTLEYSTYLGGGSYNGGPNYGVTANSIAVDSSGNAYVTGSAFGSFPITPGAFQTKPGGLYSAFVTKFNASGSALVYSTYLGGTDIGTYNSDNGGVGIAIDSGGNAYVTGSTYSTNFPITPGAFQTVSKAGTNGVSAFVTKLNASGSALVYSTYLGGSGIAYQGFTYGEGGYGIAVDSSGNAYVTGSTPSADFPVTPGAFQSKLAGGLDAFVSKFNLGQANPNPAPTLSSVSPSSVPAGGSAMPVTLTGTGFVAGTTVLVNGAARAATFVDAAHLTMTLASADLNAPRSLVLAASTPAPGGGVSNAEVFLVTPAGAPSLRFAIVGLTRVDATHVTLQFAISNTGTGPGSGIQVLSGSITANGAVMPLGGLPLSVSPVAAGATSAPLSVPLGNQTAGASVIISLKGTSAAAVNFSASYRLVMP